MKVRQMVGKKQEDQIVDIYKEINDAIQAYAQHTGNPNRLWLR